MDEVVGTRDSLHGGVRLQEVNKQWNESPFIADNVNQLSLEARDLLDRIFVLDPSKRITIPEIMRHAWCAQHPGYKAPPPVSIKRSASLIVMSYLLSRRQHG